MVCPNCQKNISGNKKSCNHCGQDLTLYKKVLMASNMYYNNGLARAKVRDLSGAITALKKSLELNKANTDARNLLGLIYFEMGETVAALSEWVISKHFKPDDNDAERYINAVQENPTKLDGLNQAIKRYNNALVFAKQGSDDLATIQLKRVISLNPHFLRAYHLLALIYMKNQDKERAKKCLLKAAKIDVSNTTTLKYLRELEAQPSLTRSTETSSNIDNNQPSTIMPISSYREDKPNVMAFVNLVIGVIIGLSVSLFLLIPSIKNNEVSNKNKDVVDYSEKLAALEEKDTAIAKLQDEKAQLQLKLDALQQELDSIEEPNNNPQLYDPLFEASSLYMNELTKRERDRELLDIAEILSTIDTSQFESEESLQLYERLTQEIFPIVSDQLYDEGHDLYSAGKYEEALETLNMSYNYNSDNVDAIYFIARSYHRLEDYENARVYYEIVINDFSDSRRFNDAKQFLNSISED